MCARAWIDGHEANTVGELRQLVHAIVFHRQLKQPAEDEWCLCVVDFESTAHANGCKLVVDEIGDYLLIRPLTAPGECP